MSRPYRRQGSNGTPTTARSPLSIQEPFSNNESSISVSSSVTPWQTSGSAGGDGANSSNRELFPSSLQRHGSTSTQDSLLEGKMSSMNKEEQVRLSLLNLNRISQDQKRVLNDTFYVIMEKFDELKETNGKFVQLSAAADEQLTMFKEMSGRSEQEYDIQVKNLQELQDEGRKIEELQRRLLAEKQNVEDYRSRMEAVRIRIQKHQEHEELWRERASKRLRILWIIIAVVLVTWLLLVAFHLFWRSPNDLVSMNWTDESLDAAERAKRLLRLIDKEIREL